MNNITHCKATDMEAGQAGITSDADSTTICEKSPTGFSQDTFGNAESEKMDAESITRPWLKMSWLKRSLAALPRSCLHTASNESPPVPPQETSSSESEQPSQSIMSDEIYHAEPEVRKLDNCPMGYPRLAAFLDSDECFMLFRRFGFIQSRLLLDKQDELRELEEALDDLDQSELKKRKAFPQMRDLPVEQLKQRKTLMTKLETSFCAYANLIDAAQKMVALKRPAKRDLASVQNFMGKRPLVREESSWANKEEDIITLRGGREHAWLDTGIEKVLKEFNCPLLQRIFGDERSRQKYQGNDIVYYSRTRITRLANLLITTMVLLLLVVPIYVLYHLINDVHTDRAYAICMGVLFVSTLAFSAVLSLFTSARRHEILAAAAGYCAVLVVFLGNIGIGSL